MSIIADIKKIKSTKKELREFALVIGIFLLVVGFIALWRHKGFYYYYIITGVVFIAAGYTVPNMLLPLQKAWMGLAVVIGFFMSRVVLFVLYYLVISPIGIIARVAGKDMLDQKIESERSSYWLKKDKKETAKESYLNQY